MKKFVEKDVAENPLYHDTWKLLKKYRDVVWSLEISVGSDIEHHAKCIERSHKML